MAGGTRLHYKDIRTEEAKKPSAMCRRNPANINTKSLPVQMTRETKHFLVNNVTAGRPMLILFLCYKNHIFLGFFSFCGLSIYSATALVPTFFILLLHTEQREALQHCSTTSTRYSHVLPLKPGVSCVTRCAVYQVSYLRSLPGKGHHRVEDRYCVSLNL